MTVIALDKFQGEIPRLPPHLLPEGAAQRYETCARLHENCAKNLEER